MRKMISVIAALSLALSLAACGSAGSSSAPAAGSASGSTAASASASGSAASDNVLTVAMECAYAPYNWTQPDDSNGAVPIKDSSDYAYGYDVMMAKKIAEELGMELEIVKLDWDSLVPAVQSGTVDCVIAGQSITSERLQSVDFTDPYYYATIVTLTKADSPYASAKSVADLAGATATSQLNTIWYTVCLPQIPDANILPAQESAPAMLVALNSGACDIVVTDMPTGKGAVAAYSDLVLLDFAGTDGDFEVSDEEINIGISVQKGNTELLDKLNSVLSTMTADDFDAMMEEAISVQPLTNGSSAPTRAAAGRIPRPHALVRTPERRRLPLCHCPPISLAGSFLSYKNTEWRTCAARASRWSLPSCPRSSAASSVSRSASCRPSPPIKRKTACSGRSWAS